MAVPRGPPVDAMPSAVPQTDPIPITSLEFEERRGRLCELLVAAGHQALVLEPGASMTYLTGIGWPVSERFFALVILGDGTTQWIVPAFESERLAQRVGAEDGPGGEILAWEEDADPFEDLGRSLRARGVERVAFDPAGRVFAAYRLGWALEPVPLVSDEPLLQELRWRKDEHELALLRTADAWTREALEEVVDTLAEGMTDTQIGQLVLRALTDKGLSDPWVLPLLGPGSAEPHGSAQGHVLKRGEPVLIDSGGSLHGYRSDHTRSFVYAADPSDEYQRAWDAVREAQECALKEMAPGITAASADRAARDSILEAGFGTGFERFVHRLGHGIGLENHEPPFLAGSDETVLLPGMVFAVEPGIYLKDRWGIRLEDVVTITSDGCERLGVPAETVRWG